MINNYNRNVSIIVFGVKKQFIINVVETQLCVSTTTCARLQRVLNMGLCFKRKSDAIAAPQ
jgi:hypothetical protein